MELVSSGRGMKVGGDLLKLESRFVCLLVLVFFFSLLPSELCWTWRVWGYLTKLFFLLVSSFLYVAGDSVSHLSFAVCEPHGFFFGPICFIHPGMSSCSSQRYLRSVLGSWRASISFRPTQLEQSPTVCLFIETGSLYVTLVVLDFDTLSRLSLNPQRISLPLPVHTPPHLEVCTLWKPAQYWVLS